VVLQLQKESHISAEDKGMFFAFTEAYEGNSQGVRMSVQCSVLTLAYCTHC
jgi:hypothetical protein